MVHEWWGLNSEITEMADRLAAEGYVVLAPDTYRGQTTSQIPRALFLRLTTPADRVDGDMQAAFDYLAALDTVNANQVGVMGFCYGGGVALRHGVSNPAVRATVNLYGDTIDDPAAFGALLAPDAGPVLGIFGAQDQQIPVTRVRAFEAALNAAGIASTVTIYDGVGHAFVNPASVEAGGAAAEAWAQILAFLDGALRG
jgi:carboxymethylenebutenolidase